MATPNFMKRISFLDGQILHDFHLNIMQKNIAEAIKEKVTKERYDMLLMTSDYEYYFCDPLINETYKHPDSTAALNVLTFTLYEGSWISPVLTLPEITDEIYIYANYEDYPADGALVKFYYRVAEANPWQEVAVDTPIPIAGGTKYVQIMMDIQYTGTTRPTVYDYCVMSRKMA